ncbi:MAG: response regulator transcription factor [Verrucomicrobiota bacterium]|nr:response regulator transcription factor [Verrucomicrobiota bacterium]
MARVGKEARKRARKATGQPKPLPSKPQAPDALSGGTVDNPKCELPEAIRIIVVDDHPLFRHGLVQLLNSDDGFSVCGEASSAPEALTLTRKLKPHLVIVDLGLKGPGGLELTKSIRFEFPKMPVLVLSMHDEPTYAVRSLRAGANGYVTKQDALGSVLIAVREVIDGRVYLSPSMASEVISNVILTKREPGANPTDTLSDREIEILERIGKGEEVKSIARALHLSPKTVETHRAHIKDKLKLENARQVARYAVQWASARGL